MENRNNHEYQQGPLSSLVSTLGSQSIMRTMKDFRPVFRELFIPSEIKGTDLARRCVDDSIAAYIHATQEGLGDSEALSIAHAVSTALLEQHESKRVNLDEIYGTGCLKGVAYIQSRLEGSGHYSSLGLAERFERSLSA